MRGLVDRECDMMRQLSERLGLICSPVVRSQLLMQMSQLIDIAYLGDTSSARELELQRTVDELDNRLFAYENTGNKP